VPQTMPVALRWSWWQKVDDTAQLQWLCSALM